MTELEATRLKLKCLEMVEGTKSKWWEVIKCNGQIPYAQLSFSGKAEDYELALGIFVEGKPVWEGDELYTKEGAAFIVRADTRFCSSEVSWNPPKPKNENKKENKLRELLAIQKRSCDCVNDSYFRGMYNGMEVMLACVENREAGYIPKPKPKTVMVEFLAEDAARLMHCLDLYEVPLATRRAKEVFSKALENLK